MRAMVTVIGKDKEGIIAKVSGRLAENKVNILDINQNVMSDMFAMVMLVDISKCVGGIKLVSEELEVLAGEIGMKIHVMHEDVFNSMHRI